MYQILEIVHRKNELFQINIMVYYRDSGQKMCTGPDLNMILVLSLGRADQKLLHFTLLINIPQFTLLSNSSVF